MILFLHWKTAFHACVKGGFPASDCPGSSRCKIFRAYCISDPETAAAAVENAKIAPR